MPRLVDQLTEVKIRAISTNGLHADDAGLYLQVRPNVRPAPIFKYGLSVDMMSFSSRGSNERSRCLLYTSDAADE